MVTTDILSNPLGAVVVGDGQNPRTFTASAREIISGGQFVNISGVADVSSGISSYADGDLKIVGAIDPVLCNGIALNNAESGALVTVARRGDYLVHAGQIVSGGAQVSHNASGAVANILNTGSVAVTTMGPTPIGRAMTTSASGTDLYALISLDL